MDLFPEKNPYSVPEMPGKAGDPTPKTISSSGRIDGVREFRGLRGESVSSGEKQALEKEAKSPLRGADSPL